MNLQDERLRIGQRIKELREAAGLTQGQLADMVEMQRPNINRIETGKYSVGVDILNLIAEALNTSLDFCEK